MLVDVGHCWACEICCCPRCSRSMPGLLSGTKRSQVLLNCCLWNSSFGWFKWCSHSHRINVTTLTIYYIYYSLLPFLRVKCPFVRLKALCFFLLQTPQVPRKVQNLRGERSGGGNRTAGSGTELWECALHEDQWETQERWNDLSVFGGWILWIEWDVLCVFPIWRF